MVANRALAAVVVCGVLLACVPVRASDKKPPEPEKFAVLSFAGIDPDETVKVAKKVGHTKIVRIPLFHAVLAWGTDEELAGLRWMLRPL